MRLTRAVRYARSAASTSASLSKLSLTPSAMPDFSTASRISFVGARLVIVNVVLPPASVKVMVMCASP